MFLQFFQQLFCFFLHVGETGSFRKPLRREEEQACFEALAAGDRSAREKLILHNMRLVAHVIKKYGMPQPEQEELISIGTVGLVKAVDSFDCTKGARFATYASKCINNEILMNFRSQKKHADGHYRRRHEPAGDGGYADPVETAVPISGTLSDPTGDGDPGASLRTVRLRTHDPA